MNENLNLPPFVKGDRVVYIKSASLPKNSVHTVIECGLGACGGCYFVRVKGYNYDPLPGIAPVIECVDCGGYFLREESRYEAHTVHSFRKVQESKFRAVSFEKVMEETEIICEN